MNEERIRRTHEQRIKSRYCTDGVFPKLQKDIDQAQRSTPSFAISTSDFDLTSSSWQALAETPAAADSDSRLEPEREGRKDVENG
jgi:hypothetical protein